MELHGSRTHLNVAVVLDNVLTQVTDSISHSLHQGPDRQAICEEQYAEKAMCDCRWHREGRGGTSAVCSWHTLHGLKSTAASQALYPVQ